MKKFRTPFLRRSARAKPAREQSAAPMHFSAAVPVLPAFVHQLDLQEMGDAAGVTVARRGVMLAREPERFRIETVLADSVALVVQGDTNLYDVKFFVDDEDRVVSVCNCPHAEGRVDQVCKHTVAAAIHLRNLAETQTPSQVATAPRPKSADLWRRQLQSILAQPGAGASEALQPALLAFALTPHQDRHLLRPVVIEPTAVPESTWHDAAALSSALQPAARRLQQAQLLKGLTWYQTRRYHFLNAPDWLLPLVEQAAQEVQNSQLHSYYRGGHTESARLWHLLSDMPVFHGTPGLLLHKPLRVSKEVAEFRIGAALVESALQLWAELVVGERVLPLAEHPVSVYNDDPLWVSVGNELFAVQASVQQLLAWRKLGRLVIPDGGLDEFFRLDYPDLLRRYPVQDHAVVTQTIEQVAPQPRLYLSEQSGTLLASLRFAYGGFECDKAGTALGESYLVQREGLGTPRIIKVRRDVAAEQAWHMRVTDTEYGLRASRVGDAVPFGALVLRKAVPPFGFLKDKVPLLTAAGVEIFGEDTLTLPRINRQRPTIAFNISSNIDWFDVKANIAFGDMNVSLAAVRKALRGDRFIKLADGSVGEIPEDWLHKYQHLFGLAETRDDTLRLGRHHVALLDALADGQAAVTADGRFEQVRQQVTQVQGIVEQPLPVHFNGELRPYQRAGFDWLHFLRANRFGGCLADDMGTGKTVQTLAFLQSLKEARAAVSEHANESAANAAHLLVLPRSLVINWVREAARFAPQLKVLDFSTPDRAADPALFEGYDLVLTTYGVLIREMDRLRDYPFDTVILDEAQAIKNPQSESAKAVRQLNALHRVTLTGTPVENNTIELWSQFAFLNPGLLGSLEYFREGFAGPIERQHDEAAMQTLRALVFPFILRRTKEQVATELPPRSEKILWQEMEPAQRKLYDTTRDDYRAKLLDLIEARGIKEARFHVLEGLLRLRQICNHPRLVKHDYRGGAAKLGTLLDTLTTLQAEGHKALVFSQFVGMLKLVGAELQKAGIAYAYLDGATRKRQAAVDHFQSDPTTSVFLISLKAGGVGLNLTAADYVIHVDPWWNPAVEMQATDRAHRIGQQRPVFVYKLLMRDSVEEKVLQLQERKRALVKNLITTEASFFKQLTAEDVRNLFS